MRTASEVRTVKIVWVRAEDVESDDVIRFRGRGGEVLPWRKVVAVDRVEPRTKHETAEMRFTVETLIAPLKAKAIDLIEMQVIA